MAILKQDNFDAVTVGTLPTGFSAPGGVAWSVQATDPVSGPNSLQCTHNAAGDMLQVTGISDQSDPIFTFSQKLTDTPSGSVDNYKAGIVMGNSGLTTGYLFLPKSTGAGTISIRTYKMSGGFSMLAEIAQSGTWAAGDVMLTEIIRASPGVIECRLWKSGNTKPASASATITDSTFTTGTVGWYNSIAGTTNQVGIDDFQYANNTAAAPATAVLVSLSAGSGLTGAPVTVTVTTDNALTGAQTESVALTSNLAGTFSPTSITLNASTGTGTATFTPSAAGAHTITGTATGTPTLTAGTVAYSATSAGSVLPVTSPEVYFSPFNWYSDGGGAMQANNVRASSTYAWLNMRGGYMKFKAIVGAAGSIALTVDTASLASITAAGCPQIAWNINGGAQQSHLMVSGETSLSLASGLSAGTYDVYLYYRGVYITQDGASAQNYTTPNNKFKVTGILLSAGGTLAAPTIKSKTMLSYGDSITEGDLSNGGPRSATSQDAGMVYGRLLAEALDAEIGIVGFYGEAFSWFQSTWANYASGFSRLIGGLLSPQPDFITVNYGENDGDPGPTTSTVTGVLAAVAAAAPSAKLIQLIPFSGKARTNLTAATLPANGYRIDLAPPQMLPGRLVWSYDGQHPNQRGHSYLAALLANKVNSLGPAGLVARTITVSGLKIDAATLATGLTGVKVSFRDAAGPDLPGLLSYQSSAQTITGGVLSFTANTTLASGATGWVDIKAPGIHYCGTVVVP